MSDEIDDVFDAMTEGLDLDIPTVVDMSGMSQVALVKRHNEVKRRLGTIGELFEPKTEEGSDLHIEYYSIRMELKRRKML